MFTIVRIIKLSFLLLIFLIVLFFKNLFHFLRKFFDVLELKTIKIANYIDRIKL